MKQLFNEKSDVNIMWFDHDLKAQKNVLVKFYARQKQAVNVGDEILIRYNQKQNTGRFYEIKEIKERRKGAMSNMDYITAICDYTKKPLVMENYRQLQTV